MKIEFELTEEDWIAWNIFHLKQDENIIKAKKKLGVYAPISVFCLALFMILKPNTNYFGFFMLTLLGLFYILLSKRTTGKSMKNRIKKMLNKYDNSDLFSSHTILFEEEFILDTSINSENKTFYSGIKHVAENESFYFLYENSIMAIIIPKSAIPDLYKFDTLIKKKCK